RSWWGRPRSEPGPSDRLERGRRPRWTAPEPLADHLAREALPGQARDGREGVVAGLSPGLCPRLSSGPRNPLQGRRLAVLAAVRPVPWRVGREEALPASAPWPPLADPSAESVLRRFAHGGMGCRAGLRAIVMPRSGSDIRNQSLPGTVAG